MKPPTEIQIGLTEPEIDACLRLMNEGLKVLGDAGAEAYVHLKNKFRQAAKNAMAPTANGHDKTADAQPTA